MRRRYLLVSSDILGDAFQPQSLLAGFRLRATGIPSDMKIVGCFWEHPMTIVLVVESAEFDEVAPGATPADLIPMFHKEMATE